MTCIFLSILISSVADPIKLFFFANEGSTTGCVYGEKMTKKLHLLHENCGRGRLFRIREL
jgi:hypothetical protein